MSDEQALLREPIPQALGPYRGETYYDLPALKPGHYKWLIVEYFWVGGLAGSAQVLATAADLFGSEKDRVVVRHGRYMALAGGIISPALLIADLYTPQRFFNMLRIVRPTSPMSVGAWVLAGFGTLSGLAAAAQLIEDRTGSRLARLMGRLVGVPAAVAGMVMSYYTGTLLTGTSVPLWASVPKLLPALFASSAASTAAAALTLSAKAAGADEEVTDKLEAFDAVAGAAEAAVLAATDREWHRQGIDSPVRRPPVSTAYLVGAVGVGVALPLAIHGVQKLTGRKSKTASAAAAVATLVGGFLLRTAIVFGGRESARNPRDYFRVTQHPAEPARTRLPAAPPERRLADAARA